MKKTKILLSFVCLSIFIIPPIPSLAQVDSTLYKLKALNIPALKKGVKVYYSPGYKKRAKHIQSYTQDAMRFYKKNLKVELEIAVAVLTKSHWEKLTRIPFDIPFGSDSPHVVFLPANLGEGVVTSNIGKTKQLAKIETLQQLKSVGVTFDQAEMKGIDFIGLHELGHLIAERLEISFFPGKPNKWYNEFVASYLAYAYLHEKAPKSSIVTQIMAEHSLGTMPNQQYTRLEDFERLYSNVGPENYGWFQNKFIQLVIQIYNKKGLAFIKELVTNTFPKNEKTSIESLLLNLEKITPGFITWAKEL